jgi:hypothetical protein
LLSVNSIFVVPIAPKKRVKSEFSKAAHRRRRLALKRLPAHLAVGHDIQADGFLESDYLVHRAIFDFFEFNRGDGPRGELLLSREQFRGPKQAADDVGMGGDHDL